MSQLLNRLRSDIDETDINGMAITRCKFESQFESSLNSYQEMESTSSEELVLVETNVEESTKSSIYLTSNKIGKIRIRQEADLMKNGYRVNGENLLDGKLKNMQNNMNCLTRTCFLQVPGFPLPVKICYNKTPSTVTAQSHMYPDEITIHSAVIEKNPTKKFHIPFPNSQPKKVSSQSEVCLATQTTTSATHLTVENSSIMGEKLVLNSYHEDVSSIAIAGNKMYQLFMVSGITRALLTDSNIPSIPKRTKCKAKNCLKFSEVKCYRCRNSKYCSINCQHKDWFASHIYSCKPLSSGQELKNKCYAKHCSNTAQLLCSKCKVWKYCSPNCQSIDWYKGHINDCKRIITPPTQ